MLFGDARWSLGDPRCSPGAARGLHSAFGVKNECFSKFEKKCFWPLASQGLDFKGSF